MAQDLSQTIQEGLAQTLTDLLGIDAKFQETTKTDQRDIQDTQLLQVNTQFEFDKLSTVLKFMVPASAASIVFNTMMGASDYDISDTIDDDTIDAMGEFVSNVSGSLVTAFNAKEIEELGKAKFNIQHKEVINDESIEAIDTLYRFVIELDETPLTFFINFDEQFLPFIEEITKTEPTHHPEEEQPSLEEEKPEETIEDSNIIEEGTSEDSIPDPESVITDDKSDSGTKEEIENVAIEEENEEQEKSKKMKLLIIIISSLITIILILFLVFYFMGSEEEDIKPEEQKIEQMGENKNEGKNTEQEEVKTTPNKTLKKVNFNIKDIDIARLNGRLATLTKYEILTKEELEAQKKEEAKRLERLKKEEELKEFAKLNKEEPIKIVPKAEPKKEESIPLVKEPIKTLPKPITPMEIKPQAESMQEPINEQPSPKVQVAQTIQPTLKEVNSIDTKEEEPQNPSQLLFVLTNSIKYTLFKSLVLEINSSTARISMCNDSDGRTTILIGPFENMEQQNKMDQLIQNTNNNIETSLESLTQEEFNQRCNF